MSTKEMKLILESWRRFVDEADQESYIFLFENKKPVKTDFNLLLERCDNKILSEEQVVNLWEHSFDYEYTQLLNEIEALKKAGEFIGKVKEKVNDFFLLKQIQIVDFAKSGSPLVFKMIKKVTGPLGKFAKRHPLLTKFVATLLLAVALYALTTMMDPQTAQAKIKVGEQILSDTIVQITQGSFEDILAISQQSNGALAKAVGPDPIEAGVIKHQVWEVLELAQASPTEIPVEQISERLPEELQKAGDLAERLVKVAADQVDKARQQVDLAKELQAAGEIEQAKAINRAVGLNIDQLVKWKKMAQNMMRSTTGIEMPTPGMFKESF